MKILCSLFLSILAVVTFAQEKPPILTAPQPKKGIYRNFQEFLCNSPSIQSPFQVVCRSGEGRVEKGIADYKLVLLDSATRRRDLRKIWGVCDGESIYVNEVNCYGILNFKKIHGLGRYCYFYGTTRASTGAMLAAGAVGGLAGQSLVGATATSEGAYVLNINNGKFFLLDKETLQIILKKDPELYDQYAEDERRSNRKTLLSYIPKYNERHEDEIKFDPADPVPVTFYRRNKRESPEPLALVAGDTFKIVLTPNSLKEISWIGDSLDICSGADCKTVVLRARTVNYIECSMKGDEVDCEPVDRKIGEFYSHEVRVLNERKK